MTYIQVLRRFSNKVKTAGSERVELSVGHGSYEYMPRRVAPSCDVSVSGGDNHVFSTYFLVDEYIPNLGSIVMQRRSVKRALTAARFLEAEGLEVSVTSGSTEKLRDDIKQYDEMIRGIKRTIMYRRFLQIHPTENLWEIGLANNARLNGHYEKF